MGGGVEGHKRLFLCIFDKVFGRKGLLQTPEQSHTGGDRKKEFKFSFLWTEAHYFSHKRLGLLGI